MSRYKFLKEHDNGTHIIGAGWVLDIADGDAAPLVKSGTLVKVADNCPLKKGNLEAYDNCRPLDAAGIQAKQAKKKAEEETPAKIA